MTVGRGRAASGQKGKGHGDEEYVTVGRGRAASGQKGKGPDMQASNGTGAELSAADHGAAAESFQVL